MLPMGVWGTLRQVITTPKKTYQQSKNTNTICEKVLLSSPGPNCGVYVFEQKEQKMLIFVSVSCAFGTCLVLFSLVVNVMQFFSHYIVG